MSDSLVDGKAGRLIDQANRLVRAGSMAAARAVLAALRRTAAPASEIEAIDARIALAEGRPGDALVALDTAIAGAPGRAALHLLRAEARAQVDDVAGAASDAADAVILAPEDPKAKAMLGLLLVEAGQYGDAIACLSDALRSNPTQVAAWRGLAEALSRLGDAESAMRALVAAVEAVPGSTALRVAAMMRALQDQQHALAVTLGEQARRDGVADACAFGLLGHAYSHLGRHEEAGQAYRDALNLAPEDPYVRHLVRAAGLLPDATKAPTDYVETVFDGYAERFEQHLIGLGYRVPGLMRAAVLADRGDEGIGRVLDLGCGTGLMGVMLADLAPAELVGVDLSGPMLEQARLKDIYTRLEQGEIEQFLARETGRWDLILAADVLCYFGDIAGLLARVRQRLPLGGRFYGSVELATGDKAGAPGWRTLMQGRFVHDIDYIRDVFAGAGLELTLLREETLRMEAGREVRGLLIGARKAVADA